MGLRMKESHVVCLPAPMRRCHVVLRGDDGHGAAVEGAQRGKPWRDASSACRLEREVKQRPRAEKAAFLLARAERPPEEE